MALWRKLAERYADEPWIGGYDILNEPNWTFEGKDKNGREDVSNQPIWDLYKAITRAIREVDSTHLSSSSKATAGATTTAGFRSRGIVIWS